MLLFFHLYAGYPSVLHQTITSRENKMILLNVLTTTVGLPTNVMSPLLCLVGLPTIVITLLLCLESQWETMNLFGAFITEGSSAIENKLFQCFMECFLESQTVEKHCCITTEAANNTQHH